MLQVTIYNDDFSRNTALQRWNNVTAVKRQCCNNVPALRCAKNRRCELSRVTSFYKSLSVARIVYLFIFWQISNPYPPQLDVERNDKTLSLDISTLLTVSANTQQLVTSFLYFRTTQNVAWNYLAKKVLLILAEYSNAFYSTNLFLSTKLPGPNLKRRFITGYVSPQTVLFLD